MVNLHFQPSFTDVNVTCVLSQAFLKACDNFILGSVAEEHLSNCHSDPVDSISIMKFGGLTERSSCMLYSMVESNVILVLDLPSHLFTGAF